MRLFKSGNWGLRLLALLLAVVLYHALKDNAAKARANDNNHDRSFFHYR